MRLRDGTWLHASRAHRRKLYHLLEPSSTEISYRNLMLADAAGVRRGASVRPRGLAVDWFVRWVSFQEEMTAQYDSSD